MSRYTLSKRDCQWLAETAFLAREAEDPASLGHLMKWCAEYVGHDYSACGHFSLTGEVAPGLGYSNYNKEFCQLYLSQGLVTDPAVVLLASTRRSAANSQDDPRMKEPVGVTSLKLDSGIRTCLSLAVRGLGGSSVYFAFSNFPARENSRLRQIVDLIGPHYALAYMRAFSRWRELEIPAAAIGFSPREEEIMRWASDGKTNWEISVIMNLSLDTVKYYLKNIMERLHVETRAAAVARWQWATSNLLKPVDHHSPDSIDRPQ